MLKKAYIWLPIFVAAMSFFDLASTLLVLHFDDRFSEANPIMNYVIVEFGYIATIAIKCILITLQAWGIWWICKRSKESVVKFLVALLCTVFGLLGIWWTICWIVFIIPT